MLMTKWSRALYMNLIVLIVCGTITLSGKMFCLKTAEISVPNLFLWAFKGPSTFAIATCYFLVNARKLKFTNKMSKGVCIVRPPTKVLHPGILRFQDSFFFRMNKLQHSRMLKLVNETNKYRVHWVLYGHLEPKNWKVYAWRESEYLEN